MNDVVEAWSFEVKSREARVIQAARCVVSVVLHLSLVHPPSAGSARVRVWADNDGKAYELGDLTAEQPTVVPTPVLLFGSIILYHDSADAVVRFDGGRSHRDHGEVSESESDDAIVSLEDQLDGSDECGEDERSGGGPFVPEGRFLGPAQFGATEKMAAFMRVAAVEPADLAPGAVGEDERKEITVLCRITHFWAGWPDGRNVQKFGARKLHRLRFIVPGAGNLASSLRLVGSPLDSLLYPHRSKQLEGLWADLMARVTIPPQATRVQVLFDVGVLMSFWAPTPERMEHMRRELEAKQEGGWSRHRTSDELFLPEQQVLMPARFASSGNTGGLMSVVTDDVAAAAAAGSKITEKEILVFYRYTHFCGNEQGRGTEDPTFLRRLRFVVPPAGDPACSLPWVASSLAPLIYQKLDREHLQDLWSKLVASVSIPSHATRVQVMFDVGVLPYTADHLPACMENMRRKLEAKRVDMMLSFHTSMDLNLPEPVLCKCKEDEADREGSTRPAKRRKVAAEVAGEDCPICFEELESGLVKWPGCSLPHVFHGKCLERSLKESVACPLCRHELYRR